MLGGVREHVAVVRRRHVDAARAGAARYGADKAVVLQFRIQVGVAAVQAPGIGQLPGEAQFEAVDFLLAGVLAGAVVDRHTCVVHHGMEDRRGQVQAVVEQVPLGAQFEVLGVLRLEVGHSRAQTVGAVTSVHARRGRRGAPGQVDAAVGRRLEHHAGLVVQEVVVIAHAGRRRTGHRRGQGGAEVVVAQAEIEAPLCVEFDGVEQVRRGGLGALFDVQCLVAAIHRVGRRPRIVRVRIGEAGAVVAGGRAGGRALAVAGQRVTGARGHQVAAAGHLLVAVLHTGAVAVLERAGLERAGQAQLVGEALDVDGAAVGTAPQGAVVVRVALAVVRLGPQVVVAGVAQARDVAQLVATEVVAGVQGADVGAGALEVTVDQAVVVVAVRHHRAAIDPLRGRRTVRITVRETTCVRQVVALHVVVAGDQLRRAVQAERDRWCDAPAADIGSVAAGDVRLVLHQVQAGGDAITQHVVGVHGAACVAVGTDAHAGAGFVLQLRRLAHQVQAATTGVTAAVGRARALDHFHLLQVEDLARLRADVAQAVDEDVALRIEATDEGAVTGRVAAFAGTEGDARHHAQRILQIGRTGFGDQLLRHD